jgi:hypothetical protein
MIYFGNSAIAKIMPGHVCLKDQPQVGTIHYGADQSASNSQVWSVGHTIFGDGLEPRSLSLFLVESEGLPPSVVARRGVT